MPPRRYSRYTFCSASLDDGQRLVLTEREPFRYQPRADNRVHVAATGDTLFTIAHRYFSPLPRPAGLWWIIADFQPEPILDATLALDTGRMLVIPSVRVVVEEIFSESRRQA